MRTKIIYLIMFLFFILSSCKKQDQGVPGKNEVWLMYKAINPTQMIVAVGTTVSFINKDNASHTATSSGSSFDSGTIKSGDTYTYTFTTAGTYYFYCNYHSSNGAEQGAIKVQ